MSKAYATKDQMKVWKSSAVQYKDEPERATNQVMLTVKTDEAYLVGTDGYQLMKRHIALDEDTVTKPSTSAIPRLTMEKAEKAMKQGDVAYFDDCRIVLKQPIKNDDGDIVDYKVFAELPYIEQLEMFSDFETAIEKGVKSQESSRTVTFDAKVLKTIVEQLRSDDNRVYVTMTLHGELDVIVLKAFDGDETRQITGAVMPIKG